MFEGWEVQDTPIATPRCGTDDAVWNCEQLAVGLLTERSGKQLTEPVESGPKRSFHGFQNARHTVAIHETESDEHQQRHGQHGEVTIATARCSHHIETSLLEVSYRDSLFRGDVSTTTANGRMRNALDSNLHVSPAAIVFNVRRGVADNVSAPEIVDDPAILGRKLGHVGRKECAPSRQTGHFHQRILVHF